MSRRPSAARVSATIRCGLSGKLSSAAPRARSSASRRRIFSPLAPSVEAGGRGGGQRVEGPADVGLDPDLDVVVGVHLGRDPAQVDDALVPVGVDPHRIELLELVADADDHVRLVEAEVDVVVAHESHRAERIADDRRGTRPCRGRSWRPAGPAARRSAASASAAPLRAAPCPARTMGRLARVEHGRRTGDLGRGGLIRPGRVDVERHEVVGHGQSLDVLGDGEEDGARAVRSGPA